ncbi:hypothetical protein BH10PSE10_BH10PSE10_02910 [soil metagenome]
MATPESNVLAKLKEWLWQRSEPKAPIVRPLEEPLPFDIDRVAELIERGDPNDFEEIARRVQG